METILVSGKRLGQNVQQVAGSIELISNTEQRLWQFRSANDLVNASANITLQSRSPVNSGFSIRGVGSANWHINANQSIAQIIDDTAIIGPYASKMAFFDLQGIEVHRGPQSTLYGLNASGGAVNFVTNRPELDDSYVITDLQMGRDAQQKFTGIINYALAKDVAVRIAGQLERQDGVWHNLYYDERMGDIDTSAFRVHLAYEPSASQSWLLTYQHSEDKSDKIPYLFVGQWSADDPNIVNGIITPNNQVTCSDIRFTNRGFFTDSSCVSIIPFTNGQVQVPDAPGYRNVYDPAQGMTYLKASQWRLRLTQALDDYTFHSITSFDEVASAYMETLNGIPQGLAFMPSQIMDNTQYSQEFRLSYQSAQNQAQIGLYWQQRNGYMGTIIQRYDNAGAPFGVVPSVSLEQSFDVLSVYGDGHYSITDQWQLYAGLRHTYNEQKGDSITRVLANTLDGTPSGAPRALGAFITRRELEQIVATPSGACPSSVGGFPCELITPVKLTSELTAFNLSVSYHITQQQHLYAQISRGFMAGAFDTRALAAFSGTADNPVGPETLDAFELGYKQTWDDGKWTFAWFYYDWQDKQTFDTDEEGNTAFLNIPHARLIGAEFHLEMRLHQRWNAQLDLATLDSEITDTGTLQNVQEGNELAQSPPWSGSASLQYQSTNRLGEFDIALGVSYLGERWGSFSNNPQDFTESHTLTNLQLTQFIDEQARELRLYTGIENLTGERFCQRVSPTDALGYSISCVPNRGQRHWYVGIEVRW